MKRFRFPLRSVQTVRSIQELKARETFSHAVAAHAETVRNLMDAREALAGLESLVREQRQGHFRPAEQVAFTNEIHVREQRVAKAQEHEVAAARKLEEAREQWVEARKNLRIVEKLEHRAKDLHRVECEHEEQAMLDDRVNALAGRLPIAS